MEDISEKFKNLQSAVKIELNKRKAKYEEQNQNNKIPEEFHPGETKYTKIAQRITKDKNPYKLTTVKHNNELTFKDINDIKIHKNRIKK